MSVAPFEALACPLDGLPLIATGPGWRCAADHTFDRARHGYAHLLPVQHKRSRDPGDSKDMVAARHRFLSAGHYQSIAAMTAALALDGLASDATVNCLDAGCGEGYYLRELAAASPDSMRLRLLGLDISKWAIQAAARLDKRCAWAVGTNARLPVLPASLDRVLCLFGFPVYAEFARVLRPGGRLIRVDAGPSHLLELRRIIYPTIKPDKPVVAAAPPGFAQGAIESLRYATRLEGRETIADLLAMTPHLFRAPPEGRARLTALDTLELTVDVVLHAFERTGTDG